MAWEKSIFIGCTHGDIVSQDAVKAVKKVIADWKPKHRVHLGDIWDFRAMRKGAGPEERAERIGYDYNCGLELLDWYKPQILTLGNHDDRPFRVAREAADGAKAELAETFCQQIEDDLRKRRIKWVPWGVEHYAKLPIGGPKLIHGYKSTMYPARAHFEHWGECIAAHVHKPDYYEARHIDQGKAYTLGTLADISKLTYANAYAAKLGWRNSFLIGMHNTKTGKWQAWEVVKDGEEWISPFGVI